MAWDVSIISIPQQHPPLHFLQYLGYLWASMGGNTYVVHGCARQWKATACRS